MTRLADLAGLIAEDVGRALHDLAAQVDPDHAIVELGSFKGKSTCYLAAGAKAGRGARVWAVDAWDLPGNVTGRFGFADPATRAEFDRQIRAARVASRVTPLQGFTTDVAARWDGPKVGLLFIDGDHAEASVVADYEAWRPHLADDAVVVFDDYRSPRNPGVAAAIDRLGLQVEEAAGWLAVARP